MKRWVAIAFIGCLLSFASANEQRMVEDFESGSLSEWDARSFNGETEYTVVLNEGNKVLRAQAIDAASGIAIETRVDLFETPYLNWRWRIDAPLSEREEIEKSGDDYVARVYVVINGGLRFWRTLAVNYVWSSQAVTDLPWPNAYAPDNAIMFALQGKNSSLQWQQEKRNVYKDLIRAFGDKGSERANEKAYRYIDAVAIMTDTDDGGGSAIAFYDDIFFSSD